MFKKGDLVQYGNNGVCKVEDIVKGMPGLNDDTEYYIMVPINNRNNVIYLPTGNDKAKVRLVLKPDEIKRVLSGIDSLNEYVIDNEKQCELIYKEAMYSLDCVKWMELLKTLCVRKQTRALNGKKVTSTDERYFKNVSTKLTEEIGVALGTEEAEKQINHVIEIFEGCVSL
ncbi:MAG: CarD family transcriptional regulator [Lachnospiraceae bacterium]|nr:CarD family transcriptional regulator [Lachnospiraceae bacterium]